MLVYFPTSPKRNSIPSIPLLTKSFTFGVQTCHSLPGDTARNPTLENATDSPPTHPRETLKLPSLHSLVQTVDCKPLWTRVGILAITQIRPSSDDNCVLELEPCSLGIFAHLNFDEVLGGTLWAAAGGTTSIAARDDKIGMRGFATDFWRAANLVFVRVWWFGNVRESAFADFRQKAVTPVVADGEEGGEFLAVVEEMSFGGYCELGGSESDGDHAHEQMAVVDHEAGAVLPGRVLAFPLPGEVFVAEAELGAVEGFTES